MSGWRIVEWSREQGRGAIESPHFKRVEFDAARADVDDFAIGEAVCIDSEISGDTVRVKRIWPDIPRFKGRAGVVVAPLDPGVAEEAERTLAAALRFDFRVARLSPEVLIIEASNDFIHGAEIELELHEPSYMELPMSLAPDEVHVATAAERGYLATRVDLSSSDVAITFVEKPDKFYFAVGASLSVKLRDPDPEKT